MTDMAKNPLPTRRSAIKTVAGASALAGIAIPHVHAQVNEELKISLIGCGGRGTGAVKNAMSVSGTLGPLKLHAMADVFEDKLDRSLKTLEKDPVVGEHVDVPKERQFIGFDGYRQAMDSMNPGDIAILTTPLAFRWPMFEYAVEKGLNVFMEKPLSADGFSSRKLLEINKKAVEKGLKVGVGLMCRHCKSRNELKKRIDDGAPWWRSKGCSCWMRMGSTPWPTRSKAGAGFAGGSSQPGSPRIAVNLQGFSLIRVGGNRWIARNGQRQKAEPLCCTRGLTL